MYPPLTRLERRCNKAFEVPGTNLTIQKGEVVIIPAMAIHYDEMFYPNPQKFDPQRFSAEKKSERNPYAYLPFGQGPRSCIGGFHGLRWYCNAHG